MLATSRILYAPAKRELAPQQGLWLWPLPRLDGADPHIFDDVEAVSSDGVEIGYLARSAIANWIPVYAVHDGRVTYAGTGRDTGTVCIDHAGGWSTHYSKLASLATRPTDRFRRRCQKRVSAGDIIGYASPSTLRIRFGLQQLINDEPHPVDVAAAMSTWSRLAFATLPPSPIASRAIA